MASRYKILDVKFLQAGMIFSAPLYSRNQVLILPEYYPLYKDILDDLIKKNSQCVTTGDLISENEIQQRQWLPGCMPQQAREAIQLYYNSLKILKQQFSNPNELKLPELQKIVSSWMHFITAHRSPGLYLQVIRHTFPLQEDYFYVHILDTMLFSLGLYTFVYSEYPQLPLARLGIGALLFDIGMLKLPDFVKFHEGVLDDTMRKHIEKHTELGYRFLINTLQVPQVFAKPALEHHEKIDGSGYPNGKKGSELHAYSLIVSLADNFTAQLRPRSFREQKESSEIVKIFLKETMPLFKDELQIFAKGFLSYVSVYPVGTYVALNSGEVAVVMENNLHHPLRPILKIIGDTEKQYDSCGQTIYMTDSSFQNIEIIGIYTYEKLLKMKNLFFTPVFSWQKDTVQENNETQSKKTDVDNVQEGGQHVKLSLDSYEE